MGYEGGDMMLNALVALVATMLVGVFALGGIGMCADITKTFLAKTKGTLRRRLVVILGGTGTGIVEWVIAITVRTYASDCILRLNLLAIKGLVIAMCSGAILAALFAWRNVK